MPLAESKITSQGQISVPKAVREKFGIGPGTVLEWDEVDGKITVRRKGKYTFEDMHKILFAGRKPKKRTLAELKKGIAQYIIEKHARR